MQDDGTFASGDSQALGEQAGDCIGRYELLQEIGEGGMGTVWLARQSEPVVRRVALKIIKLGMDTREVVGRFEAERQALALMDHEFIAKVFDGGTTESGRPYFVMELVKGVPITSYCDRAKMGVRDRLMLFGKVCEAIQHAHQKGIIHRDIKPSNVLVADQDGEATPKVIDFGIAKATSAELTQRTLFTEIGQLVGTPEYMAPEQASMDNLDIDTRADVYALGVLLYELLTGSKTFDLREVMKSGYAELMRRIREVDPEKPSTRVARKDDSSVQIAENRRASIQALERRLRGDLDWIVMKAIEKERNRRYGSASELAEDVHRYLEDATVSAAPPSGLYRMGKFVRRRKKTVAAVSVIVTLFVAGSIGTGVGWARAEEANDLLADALKEKGLALETAQKERKAAAQAAEEATAASARATREAERASLAEREAREEANRANEAERDAEREADRAREAEQRTRERAAELEQVAAFQADQFDSLNVPVMGGRLRDSLLKALPEEHRADTEAALARINFTNIALAAVEENFLRRSEIAIDSKFRDQPLVRARLLNVLGNTRYSLGMLEGAMAAQERAVELRREELGPEHRDTLNGLVDLAIILRGLGEGERAENLLRQAVETNRRVLGVDDPQTILALSALGSTVHDAGRFDEAREHYEEALKLHRKVKGDDSPEVAMSLVDLGSLHYEVGELDKALPLFEESLELHRRIYPARDVNVLAAMSNLGAVLQGMGRLDEADELLVESLEGSRDQLGDSHPSTLSSIKAMGYLRYDQGRMQESEVFLMEAAAGNKLILGEEHPNTLQTLNDLAAVRAALGKHVESAQISREALAISRRVRGNDHLGTLVLINNLGYTEEDLGNELAALELAREYVEGVKRVVPGDEARLAEGLYQYAKLSLAQQHHAEAEAAFRELIRLREKAGRPANWRAKNIANSLGAAIAGQGRFEEAESLLCENADWLLVTPGTPPPGPPRGDVVGDATRRVVEFYRNWQEADPGADVEGEAEAWQERWVEWRERHGLPTD